MELMDTSYNLQEGASMDTSVGLDADDLLDIVETLRNVQMQVNFVQSKLKGEDIVRSPKKNPKMKKWLTNNMLLIVCVWQLIELTTIALCELIFDNTSAVAYFAITLGCIWQIATVAFILVTSVKLGKQLRHRTATGWFLAQSYLSTIVLFAGLYSLIYQISEETFSGITSDEQFALFTFMLYFSATTMTTVGFGDIVPSVWWAMLLVMCQSLISVMFTTVIFAKGLTLFTGQLTKIKESRPKKSATEGTPLSFSSDLLDDSAL